MSGHRDGRPCGRHGAAATGAVGCLVMALLAAPATRAEPQDATVALRALTPETALHAARVALEACRAQGHQVAVAVVDRAGGLQAFVRDRYAGPHTVDAATRKAWSAASFKQSTAELALQTQPGRPMSGLRALPQLLAAGGGLPIEAGGSLLGGLGVSGAPGGEADEACAKAGLAAIAEALEFEVR